jgi:NADP-reducing hydrogenase subunit HndB
MDHINSMKDLENARAAALKDETDAAQQCPIEIRISLGSCGIAAGTCETLDAICQFIHDNGLTGIRAKLIGCIGLCALEPIVQVVEAGHPPITYGRVVPAVVQRIFKEHIAKRIPVQEYVIENI